MSDDQIVPVRHTTLSGVGSTTAGTVGGALKGGVGSYLKTTAGTGLFGAVLGGLIAAGAFSLIPGAAAGVIGWAIFGGVVGLVGGALVTGPVAGMFGGLFGGIKGGTDTAHRVAQEKGAATMLDAQVAAYQAQSAAAQTNVYTAPLANNDNKYNFPASGSAMNMASSNIQASSADNQGLVDGQQLQRA